MISENQFGRGVLVVRLLFECVEKEHPVRLDVLIILDETLHITVQTAFLRVEREPERIIVFRFVIPKRHHKVRYHDALVVRSFRYGYVVKPSDQTVRIFLPITCQLSVQWVCMSYKSRNRSFATLINIAISINAQHNGLPVGALY